MNYEAKGKWEIAKHGLTSRIFSGNYQVAEGICNKANAHLIAAAPRMVEFIKKLAHKGNKEALNFIKTLDLEKQGRKTNGI